MSASLPSVVPSLAAARSIPSQGLVLEGAVDPSSYIVGPGDVFTISIGGSIPRQMPATVSADGTLAVPEAGSFSVAGRSLSYVSRTVGSALQRRYAHVVTDVTLASPRQFYVHVAGAVPLPGRHAVSAASRVEDAVAFASGTGSALSLARYGRPSAVRSAAVSEARPALRNVAVRHASGRTSRVDLMRYFATGDISFNPILEDGDAISIQTFDPVREGVVVGGAVDRPGIYDVRPDDSVLDLLVVVSGADVVGRIGSARVTKMLDSGESSVIEVAVENLARTRVEGRDHVYAVPRNPLAGVVEVIGAVRFPGLYQIRTGETAVESLLEMAGGAENDALLRGAYLERRAVVVPTDSDSANLEASSQLSTGQRPESERSGVLTDLDLFSQTFLASELRRVPRVALNLDAPESYLGVTLREGDRLIVPRDLGGVRVTGQVGMPGIVPLEPGQSAAYYVERAGGVGPGASETYVIEAGTNRVTLAGQRVLESGDAVFVDRSDNADSPQFAQLSLQERADLRADVAEARLARAETRQDRAETRQERADVRQARYQLIQTVIGAIGTAVSVVIAIVALNNSRSN